MHLSTRQLILAFLVMLGVAPLLNAQYVRIDNPGTIPPAGMTAPTVLKSAIALYTEDARTHGIEGTVTIEALIGEDGNIRSTKILKGLGFGLDEVALASVQGWALSPATRNGLPVSVGAQIDVAFSLRSANAVRMDMELANARRNQEQRNQLTQTLELKKSHLALEKQTLARTQELIAGGLSPRADLEKAENAVSVRERDIAETEAALRVLTETADRESDLKTRELWQ
jgi:TonB family protein